MCLIDGCPHLRLEGSRLCRIHQADSDEPGARSVCDSGGRWRIDVPGGAPPRFGVKLTCCGRDDGGWLAATWAEADRFRETYLNAKGHSRSAIIVDARKAPCDKCGGTNAVCVVCGLYANCEHVRAGGRRVDCPQCSSKKTSEASPK